MAPPRPRKKAGRRKAGRRRITPDALLTPDGVDTETDRGGEDDRETGPLRRCAVTRERLPKEKMIRFVIGPDKAVVADVSARLPGRGIWLSARRDVIETACSKGAFARAARANVSVPPDLLAVLQAGLARRVGDLIGLARRAGQAVAGYQKAREWLESGRAALIVQAADGSRDERVRFLAGRAGRIPAVTPLDAAALGAVFGREHTVHVAIASGRFAELLSVEADRLSGVVTSERAERTAESAKAKVSMPARENAAAGGGIEEVDEKGAGVSPAPDGVKAGK